MGRGVGKVPEEEEEEVGEKDVEESEVVKVESDVEVRSVVSGGVGENVEDESSLDVGVGVSESGMSVESDGENGVEGSIVMEESVGMLLNSVGRVSGGEVSVGVSGSEVGSPNVGVTVSHGSVSVGNTSVIVESSVGVSVGGSVSVGNTSVIVGLSVGVSVGGPTSKVSEGDGGKSVDISNVGVGDTSSPLVVNGGIGPVKPKGGKVRKAVSNPMSSSLMEGVDKPQ